MKGVKQILKDLKIDETYTRPIKKYKFDKVKQNTYPEEDYNYMVDTLALPTTKDGYKYLLTIVDLWSDEVEFQQLKSLTAKETLNAFKTIIKRKHLNLPKGSICSDNGVEFKSVFHQFLKDNNIRHKLSLPYRHKQNANVESLNNALGRILMNYLTNMELKTKKPYNEWTDIIDIIRTKLNEIRKRPNGDPFSLEPLPYSVLKPKYKIGDIVLHKLEKPHNALGQKETTDRFRHGDLRYSVNDKLKIVKVLNYPNNIRYVLNTMPNVSYAEAELKSANVDEEFFAVKSIIGQKVYKGKTYYLIWWKRYKKSQSTWEPAEQLIEDGSLDEIKQFIQNEKEKKKKKKN